MNKKIISVLLAAVLIAVAVVSSFAYTPDQQRAADALNELGLFLGKGGDAGYALDDKLNRMEGITLLVRMIGKESEAKAGAYNVPFTDVNTTANSWSKPYVGYAYANKITDGYGDGIFGAKDDMTDYMFLTLTLRALGYTDKGANAQFVWDSPYELAESIGLVSSTNPDKSFLRGDAVAIFWNAMEAKCANSEDTLVDKLIAAGVFTEDEYDVARDIFRNGRSESADTSSVTTPADTSAPASTPAATTPESTPAATTPAATDPSDDYIYPYETLPDETPLG